MIFWRISAFADLTGRGGILAGGRWHTAGRPVVYLAGTPAGALLEILVHLEVDQEDLPDTLQLLKVELPDAVSVAPAPALTPGWESDLRHTKGLGDTFLKGCPALLLPVPSAIMPHAVNYLFNPMHLDSVEAVITGESFNLDSRLIKKN
ncbi:RES domain-containing protein [Pseudomonas sp. FW300-N1A1]|uniref:RES family NAD+ phosphorylase n=1 Tax=Pseudomonas sp. FW300-N1A1 TaxID=2075555 RepID=UPI000CD2C98A|nr:RES family NAD+ phosphorylase [Pseudomonas sp. FW300-N1A1]POA16914.1 RES domain-containing protein [Pseudomonas sp. FW300-N1A1]